MILNLLVVISALFGGGEAVVTPLTFYQDEGGDGQRMRATKCSLALMSCMHGTGTVQEAMETDDGGGGLGTWL